MTDEVEVSWRVLPERAPVLDAAGNEIGHVVQALADAEDDIFHGIAVKLRHGGTVEIPAAQIPKITRERVYTSVDAGELDSLRKWKS